MTVTERQEKKYGRLVQYVVLYLTILVIAGVGLYYALYVVKIVQDISITNALQLILVAIIGLLVITFLGREVNRVALQLFGAKRGSRVFVIYRFFAYLSLSLILLGIAGVSGTGLLAGSAFAGLVIGLAGQTVLSNIVAGIMIIFARPFEVGDRITFVTSQYGLIPVTYPPKFYSDDLIIPGYSGIVRDIGLVYTMVQLDNSPLMRIPNNVMIQAAVVLHDVSERWIRTRYEIPTTIDPDKLIPIIAETIRKNEWVTKPDSVRVLVTSAISTVYVVTVDALCKGSFEEPPRSSILLDIIRTVKRLNPSSDG